MLTGACVIPDPRFRRIFRATLIAVLAAGVVLALASHLTGITVRNTARCMPVTRASSSYLYVADGIEKLREESKVPSRRTSQLLLQNDFSPHELNYLFAILAEFRWVAHCALLAFGCAGQQLLHSYSNVSRFHELSQSVPIRGLSRTTFARLEEGHLVAPRRRKVFRADDLIVRLVGWEIWRIKQSPSFLERFDSDLTSPVIFANSDNIYLSVEDSTKGQLTGGGIDPVGFPTFHVRDSVELPWNKSHSVD